MTLFFLLAVLHLYSVLIHHYIHPGDNGSEWVKHWVKGGHDYYYNLNTREGTWVEPEGFLQNNTQLNKDDIQVGY